MVAVDESSSANVQTSGHQDITEQAVGGVERANNFLSCCVLLVGESKIMESEEGPKPAGSWELPERPYTVPLSHPRAAQNTPKTFPGPLQIIELY